MNLSPEEKIEFVKHQINDVSNGLLAAITCPYCDELNEEGSPLCCMAMAECVKALLDEYEAQKQIHVAQRIVNNVHAQKALEPRIHLL